MNTPHFESNLFQAYKNESNDPLTRFFLCICNILSDRDLTEGSTQTSLNEKRKEPNDREISLLFDMLKEKITNEEDAELHTDYGYKRSSVTNVLEEWAEKVMEERKRDEETTGIPHKKLPMGIGLPFKLHLSCSNGCVFCNCRIVDDQGLLLKEDPYEKAFKTRNEEDIKKAQHLQPQKPYEWILKETNREIVETMGYAFQDAVGLAECENIGLVEYLVDQEISNNGSLHFQIGYHLIGHILKYPGLVLKVLSNGVSLFSINEPKSVSLFLSMVKKFDLFWLEKVVSVITKQKCSLDKSNIEYLISGLPHNLWVYRYTVEYFNFRILDKIMVFLARQQKLEGNEGRKFAISFMKSIIDFEDDTRKFYSQDCKEDLLNAIQDIEEDMKECKEASNPEVSKEEVSKVPKEEVSKPEVSKAGKESLDNFNRLISKAKDFLNFKALHVKIDSANYAEMLSEAFEKLEKEDQKDKMDIYNAFYKKAISLST